MYEIKKNNNSLFIKNLFLEIFAYYYIFTVNKINNGFFTKKKIYNHLDILFNIFLMKIYKQKPGNNFILQLKRKIIKNLSLFVRDTVHCGIRTVNTKTKKELNYSTRKMYKQKGTGKARAGSRKNPLWRGGAIIFGPKSKKVLFKINKKKRKLLLKYSFITRIHDLVLLPFSKIKMLLLITILSGEPMQTANRIFSNEKKVLFVIPTKNINSCMEKKLLIKFLEGIKNLNNIKIVNFNNIMVHDILSCNKIFLFDCHLFDFFLFLSKMPIDKISIFETKVL